MPETKTIGFTYKEVAEALIRSSNIHEGLWGIYFEFGLGAINIATAPGQDMVPAAVIPIQKLGLQRFEEPNNLTVDAAKVNPVAKSKPTKS